MLVNSVSRYECAKYADGSGRVTKYIEYGSCFVAVDTEWFTRSEYKNLLITRDIKPRG